MSASAYDPNNVFAKILRRELPCHLVYEDADSFAFLDIMPRVDGHTLIIPKAPVRNIIDASPAVLAPVIATAQRIAVAAKRAFDADGVSLWQFSEPAGGQVVFHLHFHILPRKTGDELRPLGIMADNELLSRHAEKLKAALA